jgi:hypothetical protein
MFAPSEAVHKKQSLLTGLDDDKDRAALIITQFERGDETLDRKRTAAHNSDGGAPHLDHVAIRIESPRDKPRSCGDTR